MKVFFLNSLLIISWLLLSMFIPEIYEATPELYKTIPLEYSGVVFSLLIAASFFLLDRYVHLGVASIIFFQGAAFPSIIMAGDDGIITVISFVVFYAIFLFSRRLQANLLKKEERVKQVHDAKKLRLAQKKGREKAEQRREKAEQIRKEKRIASQIKEIKDLKDHNDEISKKLLKLESKREKLIKKKDNINTKVVSLEGTIQKESKTFEELKNKYPFLSKAKIIENR